MNKAHIIAEIRRTAEANGGKPLGRDRFEQETGIKYHEWYGRFWARWGDALGEAGYTPNTLNAAYDDDWIIEQLIDLIRQLGHFPTDGELRVHSHQNPTFPSKGTFHRLGRKNKIVAKVIEYCSPRDGYADVLELCPSVEVSNESNSTSKIPDDPDFGHVYLMKSGKHYKIGHSNAAGRREYELSIQLPERLTTVHVIVTDDPLGIETYWHKRFDSKRLNGEWFDLDAADVRAFKRRKFM